MPTKYQCWFTQKTHVASVITAFGAGASGMEFLHSHEVVDALYFMLSGSYTVLFLVVFLWEWLHPELNQPSPVDGDKGE